LRWPWPAWSFRSPADSGLGEQLRVLQRPLHRFHQPLLDLRQAAYVFPVNIGQLHEHLAQRGGLDLAQRILKVFLLHLQLGQLFVWDLGQRKVDAGHDAAQADHRRLAA
jgi:hypothetical protein